jgi:ABC-type branched-subunit amino acid transport system substrate-binding protein
MRGTRAAVALAVAMLVAACGARVSDQQVASLGNAGAATTPGASQASGDAESAGGISAGAGDTSGASGPQVATGGAGGTNAATATGAPATGDNGGETDVGVTATEIRIGNVSTLSGPVPGLFQGAVVGTLAYAAYQNSLGGIHGRKLKIDARDDGLDTGQNRAQTADLATSVFALAGSVSVNDAGGAPEEAKAGVPDVGVGLSDDRRKLPTFFSPVPTPGRGYRTGQFLWYSKKFPDAVKAVGTMYGDVAASKTSHQDMRHAAESVGWKFVYERGFQATETDFTADVVRMRQSGVKMVYVVSSDEKGMGRFAKAMAQQNWKPEVFATGPSGYDQDLFTLAGPAAVEGMYVDQQATMYAGEDGGIVPEVKLMNQWVQKVKPGYVTDLYVAWAWSSMRLLTQAIEAVGPKLTRDAVVKHLKSVDNFDSNGLVSPGGPGNRRPPLCYIVLQVKGGKYNRLDPQKGYLCDGAWVPNE